MVWITGTNNVYEVNGQTPLALLYNDQSPLENHHAAVAFKILRKDECNITAKMSAPEQKTFRKLMINVILATDMSYHFKLKDLFDGCVMRNASKKEMGDGTGGTAALQSDEDREIFLKTLLHSADLSNPAKPWGISKVWSDRVLEEFFAQGDKEKREGLPISPNMNRDTTDQAELSINFADFIIAPAYVALASFLPKVKQCVVFIVENRSRWEEIHREKLIAREKDEDKRKEELAKWNKRRVAFEKIVGSEILEYMKGPATPSSPQNRVDRRKSLRVLEELVAAAVGEEDGNGEAQG